MKEFEARGSDEEGKMENLKAKLALIVLGRSGCGKGTQARFLLARLEKKGVHHIETGRFIREMIQGRNISAMVTRRRYDRGELMPAWIPIYLWTNELVEKELVGDHLIFDGAPRRIIEAKLLDEFMAWHGRSLPFCIWVDITPREAVRRLLARGRTDDTPTVIKNRLDYFSRDVMPVIRYFAKHRRMVRVDGAPAPEIVAKEINTALQKKLGKAWGSASKARQR
jgi:adenylate kinase